MDKKNVAEIKRQIKPDKDVLTGLYCCYFSSDGRMLQEKYTGLFVLREDTANEFCSIGAAVLSGRFGRKLFNIPLPNESDARPILEDARNDFTKETAREIAMKISESVSQDNRYLVVLLYGLYDIPHKKGAPVTEDDTSDEVYTFFISAVCPVVPLSKGLHYNDEERDFTDMVGDLQVKKPVAGFLYPAFDDRHENINAVLYYGGSKDFDDESFLASLIGGGLPHTEDEQKEIFKAIAEASLGPDCTYENVAALYRELDDCASCAEAEEEKEIGKGKLQRMLSALSGDPDMRERFEKAMTETEEDIDAAPLSAEVLAENGRIEIRTGDMVLTVPKESAGLIREQLFHNTKYLMIPLDSGTTCNGIRITSGKA